MNVSLQKNQPAWVPLSALLLPLPGASQHSHATSLPWLGLSWKTFQIPSKSNHHMVLAVLKHCVGSKYSPTGVPVPSPTRLYPCVCGTSFQKKQKQKSYKVFFFFLLRQHNASQLNYTLVSIGYISRPTMPLHSRIFRLPLPAFSCG